jgi:CSLREA domain-containing protein
MVVIAAAGVGLAAPRPARAQVTITVNTAVDEDVDNGLCSLREAIIAANTNASYHGCAAAGAGVNDTIQFNLGAGTPTINISTTPLPAITQWVTIDGGASRVELHGPGGPLDSGKHGLTVTQSGFGTIIRNLVINNFADDGIRIEGDEVYVYGCYIGTDKTGTMAVPNQGFGVQVFSGNGARIGGATSGGPCTGDCNVISGAINGKAQILLDLNATGALVRGNFIGTDVTGTGRINNSADGIVDKGGGDRIGGAGGTTPGGPCTGDCNVISGNRLTAGIQVAAAATNSIILGNFIGTDVTGTESIGENGDQIRGILVSAPSVLIGGTIPEARNVVSGNSGFGIQISAINTMVQGNYIGTDASGMASVPNNGVGIHMFQSTGAKIGGTNAGEGNLISGAGGTLGFGIWLEQSSNVQVMGNAIGIAANGITPLGNSLDGVYMNDQASNNIVGGGVDSAGNIIAFNGSSGVRVDGGIPQVRSNTISRNSIYGNGFIGIDLFQNGNDNLSPPTIDAIDPIRGTSCAQCTVEIFSDSDGQGRIFEGSVFTNDGNWTFDGAVTGPNITATNTDVSNNTSAFSLPFVIASPTPSPTETSPPETPTATFTHSPTRTPTTQSASATATRTSQASATSSATATAVATASRTATPVVSATVTATGAVSPTATLTVAVTATETPTPVVTPTAAPLVCTGDCDGSHTVSVGELVTGVNIALGTRPPSACSGFEAPVGVAQLVRAVNNALNGCPS